MVSCRGKTKQNKPCRITWDLDEDGFCKYHVFQRLQTASPSSVRRCLGIKADGERCKISWDLDRGSQLCVYHISQAGRVHRHEDPVGPTRQQPQSRSVPLDNQRSGASAATEPRVSPHQDEEEDGDDTRAETSDDSGSDSDDDEHRPAPRMALLFGNVTSRVTRDTTDAIVRWTLKDASGDVVEQGTASPWVVYQLSTVRTSASMERLQLTVAIDDKKHRSVTSEPYDLNELRPSGTIKISKSRRVKVHVVPVESAAL